MLFEVPADGIHVSPNACSRKDVKPGAAGCMMLASGVWQKCGRCSHQMLLKTWELITYSFGSVHFHIIDIITNESNYFGVIIGGMEILCC